jgi:hypothetical protein
MYVMDIKKGAEAPLFIRSSNRRPLKKGAGYFLPRVWGCPPALKVPQDWGI